MGNLISSKDFHWEYTDNPHASRRVEILKKYPEIKTLMKPNGDRIMVLYGILLMVLQFSLAYVNAFVIQQMPLRFLLNITLGSFLATAIFMQIHEAAHGLVFGPNHVKKNALYGLVLSLGLVFPFYGYFKRHHKEHHKYQGTKGVDVEYPYEWEPKYFQGPLGKYIWMVANPFLQTMRSFSFKLNCTFDLPFEEKLNVASHIVFDFFLMFHGYFYVLTHLYLGTVVAFATSYIGFWNITSHVEFFRGEETSCYYGWVNYFMTFFGYHIQHHDFPNIPSRLLSKVSKIAPEYYEEFHSHDSLVVPSVKFLYDPKYGVFSRLKHKDIDN